MGGQGALGCARSRMVSCATAVLDSPLPSFWLSKQPAALLPAPAMLQQPLLDRANLGWAGGRGRVAGELGRMGGGQWAGPLGAATGPWGEHPPRHPSRTHPCCPSHQSSPPCHCLQLWGSPGAAASPGQQLWAAPTPSKEQCPRHCPPCKQPCPSGPTHMQQHPEWHWGTEQAAGLVLDWSHAGPQAGQPTQHGCMCGAPGRQSWQSPQWAKSVPTVRGPALPANPCPTLPPAPQNPPSWAGNGGFWAKKWRPGLSRPRNKGLGFRF